MKVKIISVGTEVLTGMTINTNAADIALRFEEEGYEIRKTVVVGDDREVLLEELSNSFEDVIILTGGLGPTIDDFTKNVVSEFLNENLVVSEEVISKIKTRFVLLNRVMDDSNLQQGLVFENGEIIDNQNGTAPGLYFLKGNQKIILLPGPPKEMKPMLEYVIMKYFVASNERFKEGYKLVGVGESTCEGMLKGFYEKHPNVYVAPYALDREIKYMFTSNNQNDLDKCLEEFKAIFNKYIIGDYHESIYKVVLGLLKKRKYTISFAESCTGGMAVSRVVDLAGSSSVLNESYVTYSNKAKSRILGVQEKTLNIFGAVSEECVIEMVEGLHKISKSDVCISISGIAGPGGGTKEKPVGLVYLAIKVNGKIEVIKTQILGNRQKVREYSTHLCYKKVYDMLKNTDI